MTRYTVTWNEIALDELAEAWLNSAEKDSISFAAHAIDQELGNDASTRGNNLHEGLRVLWIPPLKVIFQVRDDDRVVEISSVRCSYLGYE